MHLTDGSAKPDGPIRQQQDTPFLCASHPAGIRGIKAVRQVFIGQIIIFPASVFVMDDEYACGIELFQYTALRHWYFRSEHRSSEWGNAGVCCLPWVNHRKLTAPFIRIYSIFLLFSSGSGKFAAILCRLIDGSAGNRASLPGRKDGENFCRKINRLLSV